VVHLDVLYWRPGWQERSTACFRARVAVAVAGDAWISEARIAHGPDVSVIRLRSNREIAAFLITARSTAC
jgi:hypothetical protein